MRNVIAQKLPILIFRLVNGINLGRPFLEIDVVALRHAKIFGFDFHVDPFGHAGRYFVVYLCTWLFLSFCFRRYFITGDNV